LVGRRKDELARASGALGANAFDLAHDITRTDTGSDLITQAEGLAQSPVTILVNNAGIHLKKFAVDTSLEEFQSVLNTHLLAAHALTRALIPGMIAQRRGSILFTSSMAAFMGIPQVLAYSAAKSALFGMVATLSAELATSGVRVNAIAPGWISSEMSRNALAHDRAREKRVIERIQMARMGNPDDIGWAAVFLSSAAAAYVTGVTLPVDGGAAISF
jgi:NAD(P)-dependent dehydrogenase (short-subunit alcohol dehydrogenase family)